MEVRALTGADRRAILAWRYPGRYSTYDFDDPSALDSDSWGVAEDGELVGYCCIGAPGRLRLFVLDWNERSRKVAEGHGFAVESTLESDEGRFLVMARRGTGASAS
jgi:hypothetical protein